MVKRERKGGSGKERKEREGRPNISIILTGSDDIPAFTPAEAGTRLSNPSVL